MGQSVLEHVRGIALALPEVTEQVSHGAPCFYVRGRRPLCYLHDHHRGDPRVSLWCPSTPEIQEELVTAEPDRFFRPTPSASGVFSSWLGVYLDDPSGEPVDWDEVAAVLREAYRLVAPTALSRRLTGEGRESRPMRSSPAHSSQAGTERPEGAIVSRPPAVVSSCQDDGPRRGSMTRALDCIHEAHDDVHFSAANDEELLAQVLRHRDEKHPELSDDDMRGIVAANARDE